MRAVRGGVYDAEFSINSQSMDIGAEVGTRGSKFVSAIFASAPQKSRVCSCYARIQVWQLVVFVCVLDGCSNKV